MAKTFEVIYQGAGAATGLTVQVDVFKPDKSQDLAQSGTATEIGTTGRYHKSFDADAPGWFVEISDSNSGKAVQNFGKPEFDGHGVADAVADVQTGVNAANSALGALATALGITDGKINSLVTGQGGISSDIAALAITLATIETKVNSLVAPPMVG